MIELSRAASELAPEYRRNDPFPHIVIDDLFREEVLLEVLAAFPRRGELEWRRFDNPNEKKLGYHHSAESQLPPPIWSFLCRLHSAKFLQFLETLTGIAGLIPDPYFGGGGIHQILPGGFLKIHADFNWHPILRLDRRLNVLIYLNRGWEPEWGGELELWGAGGDRRERSIAPLFNRTVIFSTTDASLHGHPSPLRCPEGESRKSVSLYFYSNGRPEEEKTAPHDTIFRGE